MMKIVEQSPNILRLSDSEPSWQKWIFVSVIFLMLLAFVLVSVLVVRPACWAGAAAGGVLILLIARELTRSFDMEYRFDRPSGQLNVIKRAWVGRPQVELYPLHEITSIRLAALPRPRHYPGQDYVDDDMGAPVESPPPRDIVELGLRSGGTLRVYARHGEAEAGRIAAAIGEFLGLS